MRSNTLYPPRSQQRSVAKGVISQLVLVSQASHEVDHFDKARWTKELSPLLQLWKRLNQGFDVIKLSQGTTPASVTFSHCRVLKITLLIISSDQIPGPREQDPPLLAFLLLERSSAISLVQKVHGDLSKISKVIRGTAILTTDVRENAASLLKHEVCSYFLYYIVLHC